MTSIFSKKQLLLKLIFSAILLLLVVYFFKAWQNMSSLISFVSAYVFGIALLYADEQFLYKFYAEGIDNKDKNSSQHFELATRNFLFILLLPFLSIFVFTSSGSVIGIALMLALNFYLLVELWQLRKEYLLLKNRFFAMANIQMTAKLANRICLFATLYFLFLLFLLVTWFT